MLAFGAIYCEDTNHNKYVYLITLHYPKAVLRFPSPPTLTRVRNRLTLRDLTLKREARKELLMSRMKSIFVGLVLTAIAGLVPRVQAQTVKLNIAGASALSQTLALAAYNNGNGIAGATAPTVHWTGASNSVNLTDTRPLTPVIDVGTLWIVGDSASPPNVIPSSESALTLLSPTPM
jgi:hypothetical protein